MSELAETLTEAEKEQRARFVDEYMADFDAVGAAIRIGFAKLYAEKYSAMYMAEPYTLQLIRTRTDEFNNVGVDEHKRRIVAQLYKIAMSPYGPQAAKVSALSQLAKIQGIEAPVKTVQEIVGSPSEQFAHMTLEEMEIAKALLYKKPIAGAALPKPAEPDVSQ